MSFDIYISSKIKRDFNEVVKIANQQKLNIEIKDFTKDRVLDNSGTILPVYKDILKDFNGKLSLHGAFAGLNPIYDNHRKRRLTIHRFNQSLHIAKTLNVSTIVFHSGFDTYKKHLYNDQEFIKEFINNEVNFWKNYIKSFEETAIVAVLENTSERTPDILREIVKKVDSEHLKLCIDTGHVNHKTTMTVSEWIQQTGKELYYMHMHNNWKTMDDHNSLLNGTIDFKGVFKTIKETGLHPGLSLEIPDFNQTMESLKFLKENLSI